MRRPVLAALMVLNGVGPALAADRRTPPAAFGVEAPRDCGANGFALPGSAGCVRLSGSVAVMTTLRTGGAGVRATARAPGLFTTRVNGRLEADVRVPTDLGPLRVYTAVRVADPLGLGGAGHPH